MKLPLFSSTLLDILVFFSILENALLLLLLFFWWLQERQKTLASRQTQRLQQDIDEIARSAWSS